MSNFFGAESAAKVFSVNEVINHVEKKEILFDKYYQRDYEYWKPEDKQLFIKSLFDNGVGVTSLTLSTRNSCIDGQHRSNTLLEFKNNCFEIDIGTGKKYFKGLSTAEQSQFLNTLIPVSIVKTSTDEEEEKIFRDISTRGKPLSKQNKIESEFHGNQMDTDTLLFHEDKFWEKYFSNLKLDYKANRRGCIAKLLYLEMFWKMKKIESCDMSNQRTIYSKYISSSDIVDNTSSFFKWLNSFDLSFMKRKKKKFDLRDILCLWFLYKADVANTKGTKIDPKDLKLAMTMWDATYASTFPNGARGLTKEGWELMTKWAKEAIIEINKE